MKSKIGKRLSTGNILLLMLALAMIAGCFGIVMVLAAPIAEPLPDDDPFKLRKVHGYVSPMATLELTPDFLQMHKIVVELKPTFRTPADPGMSTVAVSSLGYLGEFNIEAPPGDYVLAIKRPGYLIRYMDVTVSPSDPDVIEIAPPNTKGDNGVFNLIPGDTANDMLIDNEDLVWVTSFYESNVTVNHPAYRAECDINADGVINYEDIYLVMINLYKDMRVYAGAEKVKYGI